MSASTTNSVKPPPHIPHHTVVREIGRGSYGEIWLARSLTGAWRAVKIVDRRRFEDARAFEREFGGMARFEPLSREHEGFVDILHVGRSDDDTFFYYVMELADDVVARPEFDPAAYEPRTLRSELRRAGRMTADTVIALGMSLASALSALHRHGLVHRDIKPANIIFVGGVPKVADIGLVSAMGQNSFVGTEGYVPPEGPGSEKADIYSLGKVLYEAVMGKDRLEFPALNTALSDFPDKALLLRLNEVLLRACASDPRNRYATATEMRDDLLRIRAGRPVAGTGKRRPLLPWAALVLLGAGATAWMGRGPAQRAGAGSVLIETDPPGVKVRIESMDGRWLETPARLDDVPAGTHRAHFISPLYEHEDVTFTVHAGALSRPPRVTLRRSIGGAGIESAPAGCEFDLCDAAGAVVKSGKAPAVFDDIPTGGYELRARHRGREKRAAFTVSRGERAPVRVEFVSQKFLVTSTPPGAEIFTDGEHAGTAPCELDLVEGAHELTARYGSWPEQKRSITAEGGEPAGVAFAFAPGSVKITSAPAGADVFAGGERLGETPLLVEGLAPGEAVYSLRLEGFEPAEVKAVIEPGRQVFASARFDARPVPRRGQPWENSLGMKFVPVGDVLFGVWLVRVGDYAKFCEEAARARLPVDFAQDDTHPAVRVNWEDATAFCDWLTRREREAGRLDGTQLYRLPLDAEWSAAAGIQNEPGDTPEKRDGIVRDFAWGRSWPPPPKSGNFADTAYRQVVQRAGRNNHIAGYTDGFPQTSPTGSFPPNAAGIHDLHGNVWQWMQDSYSGDSERRVWGVLRGGSWATAKPEELRLGYRDVVSREERDVIFGFRCVLVP